MAPLFGCAHSGTRVESAQGFDFARYQHIGVTAFTDRRGEGTRIAEGVDSGLRRIGRGGADMKAIAEIVKGNRPDPDFGWGIEALETIRSKASADVILFGSMAPDWKAATVTMIDTETGQQVLRAWVKPAGKRHRAFLGADEVVQETLRVFDTLGQ